MAVYIRNMNTGATRRLTAPWTGAQAKLAWSPDGQKIAFESALDSEAGSQALYVADVASGQFRQIFGPQNQKGAAYEIAFEPGSPHGALTATRSRSRSSRATRRGSVKGSARS